jgi:hypothetical protein
MCRRDCSFHITLLAISASLSNYRHRQCSDIADAFSEYTEHMRSLDYDEACPAVKAETRGVEEQSVSLKLEFP